MKIGKEINLVKMNTYLIILSITILLSIVLKIVKLEHKKFEKYLSKVAQISLIGLIICILLMSFDYQLKGKYTTSIIGMVFWVSTLLLFGMTKKPMLKIFSGIVAIPTIVIGILALIWLPAKIFFFILYAIFQPPLATFVIDESYNVEVGQGGFIKSCGEHIYVTKSAYTILEKRVYLGTNVCLTGINHIETVEFNANRFEFLIHHEGKGDKANPFRYAGELGNEQ